MVTRKRKEKNQKMKSTLKISALLIAAFSFVVAACGGGSSSTTPTVAPTVTNPPTTSTSLTITETTAEPEPEVTTPPEELSEVEILQRVEDNTPPVPETPAWTFTYTLTIKDRTAGANGRIPRITIPVYNAPNGSLISLRDGSPADPNPWKEKLTFLVTKGVPGDDWAEVLISSRPNNLRGWVSTSQFEWSSTTHHVLIDLSESTVTAWEGDELILHTLAIIGRPSRPTPVIRTAIEAKLDNTIVNGQRLYGSAYGTRILMLTAFSETLEVFDNGIPQVALHGTSVPHLLGDDISSGCIRIHNNFIDTLYDELPVGTIVNIIA